jgi:DNA-binding CsgD family transcriptional regulator
MQTLIDLSAILDVIDSPAAITNKDGIYIYCNLPYLDLVGRSSLQVIGFSVSTILPGALLDLELAAEKSLLNSGGKYVQYEMECEKLHPFNIRASVRKVLLTSASELAKGFVTIVNLDPQLFFAVMKHEFRLTNQEARVFQELIEGASIKTIAKRLGISAHTIAGHTKEIYVKTKINSRHELQGLAFRLSHLPLQYRRNILI